MSFPLLPSPDTVAPLSAPAFPADSPFSVAPAHVARAGEIVKPPPVPGALTWALYNELHTSASRIESFRLCKRKWAFQALDGLDGAQNPYAELGEVVHKLREDYLLYGKWPSRYTREGKIALAGLDKIPPPRSVEVERKFEFLLGRIRFRGRIDFLAWNNGYRASWGSLGIPLIGDHKTTSKEEYIKKPEQLVGGDPQGAIYGAYALSTTGAPFVDLHWSYMIKETRPREKQVRVRASRSQIEESFGRVVNDAQEMLTLVQIQGIRAADLEPNVRACEAFGGCPYKSVCPLTAAQRFGAFMSFENNNGASPPGFNLNQTIPGPSFAPGGPPQFAAPQAGPPQFAPSPFVQQGNPAAPHTQQQMQMQMQMQPPQMQAQQQIVTAQDGSGWVQQNGQWLQVAPAPATAPAAPAQTAAPIAPDQEVNFAAQLVAAQQPLPANATPGTVRMYSQFLQQPHLAQQYLQAKASAGVVLPTGVVPGDAPPSNGASTTDDTKKPGRPAGSKTNVKAEDITEIKISLGRIATALEDIARQASIANGPQAQLTPQASFAPNITQIPNGGAPQFPFPGAPQGFGG